MKRRTKKKLSIDRLSIRKLDQTDLDRAGGGGLFTYFMCRGTGIDGKEQQKKFTGAL